MKGRPALFPVATILIAGAALFAGAMSLEARRERLEAAVAHLDRGIDLYHRKAYAMAEPVLIRALRTLEDDWRAPYYLGSMQIERKRYGPAIPFLERALKLNPKETKILNALGVTYFKLGRLDMAKAYFWASLDLDPSNSDARGLMETMAKLQRRAAQAASTGE